MTIDEIQLLMGYARWWDMTVDEIQLLVGYARWWDMTVDEIQLLVGYARWWDMNVDEIQLLVGYARWWDMTVDEIQLLVGYARWWDMTVDGIQLLMGYARWWDTTVAVRSAAVQRGVAIPDDTDYRGAILGLARLQKTYRLPTEELAHGRIYNISAKQGMNKEDFLEMGRVFMNIDHSSAMSWFETFLRAGVPEPEEAKEAYTNMMTIYKLAEDYERAWITAHKILQEDPQNKDVKSEMVLFQRNIEVQKKSGTYGIQKYYWKSAKDKSLEYYEALCRGDNIKNDILVNKDLICVYRKGTLPYVQYKEEIHCFNPRISLFIDVITDKQAELMREKAFPGLFRAQVGDPTLNLTSDERISKLSWLFDFDPEILKISQKVADITGLSTTYRSQYADAEAFQVVSYGIGGQYEPHYDYYDVRFQYGQNDMLNKLPLPLMGTGDRISTFMFYLTNPTAGGATVFPQVGVRVPPIKNAAAFWFNFDLAGERGDAKTLHAGCPLLLGQKWVGNKWIRQGGQTFRRRCSLDRYAEDPIWYS
ncbi:hypothetical protein LSH36_317g01047 [Paralvinella palmiformis]|uniref:procollagen-proline 4-dioxygenase n=1 Tax=Paralvinella palmiformis TaxID=53620 RepID=A0AAD9N2P4_9ANNE|nr:hypothetical protein LSH36_317g01047 [Paralvinella palmiformis]